MFEVSVLLIRFFIKIAIYNNFYCSIKKILIIKFLNTANMLIWTYVRF